MRQKESSHVSLQVIPKAKEAGLAKEAVPSQVHKRMGGYHAAGRVSIGEDEPSPGDGWW